MTPCAGCPCAMPGGRCLRDGRVYDVRGWIGPCYWTGKGETAGNKRDGKKSLAF